MLSGSLLTVAFIILIALTFDYINGFHDAANAIATIVSTRVLRPQQAVLWAAFFNFSAAFLFGMHVAKTVGTGIINVAIVDNALIVAALIGAICWNLITWWVGLPSSSSHALIGGLIGAAIVKGGLKVLIWEGIIKTTCFIFVSPLLGLILGLFLMTVVLNATQHTTVRTANHIFRRLQMISSALYCLSHGANDAQKTMGIIAMVLFSGGYIGPVFHIPYAIVIACYLVLALGTMAGGWRIVKTMGTRIAKLQPVDGFCAETAAAVSIIGASLAGIPVSTTHTITGAIMGAGAAKRFTAVRWNVAGNILWAWILTIPLSGVIAAGTYFLLRLFFP